MNRIALTSSTSVSFLPFANSEKVTLIVAYHFPLLHARLPVKAWIAALSAITFVVPWLPEV